MLTIKLSRKGKKKQPTYRLVVLEKTKDPWGDCTEIVGSYNPRDKENPYILKTDRIQYWISQGAQPTDTVKNLLITAGIIKDKKANVSRLGKKAKEKKAAEEKAAAEKTQKVKEAKK